MRIVRKYESAAADSVAVVRGGLVNGLSLPSGAGRGARRRRTDLAGQDAEDVEVAEADADELADELALAHGVGVLEP
jgi:hypothetical protein